MTYAPISNQLLERMLQRGRTRMVQAVLNEAELSNAQKMYDFWHGFADCAAAFLNGRAEVMALHDQLSIQQGAVQSALARLPDHCERLSFADMKRLMLAQGVDFAAYAVAHSDVDAVVQLQDGVRVVVELDDKHAVATVDVGDGGIGHGSSFGKTAILATCAGSGKSRIAAYLANQLGCTGIVDEWEPSKPLTPGALHLTNVDWSGAAA